MSAADAPSLPTFAGFETVEKLGEGGMCAVFRVRPVGGEGRELAVKLLTDPSKTAAERFSAEARILRAIRHPNVLVVHELHDEVRPPWIVMELLAGLDLEERRAAEGAADPEVAARWFADLASGLAAVHAQGVRHRDIKPANIMLGHDGVPRLIDFGIARQTSSAHVTRQGFVLGTASYLPPEIFLDDDSRSVQDSEGADVYALGQSLYEVLVGEPLHPRVDGGDAVVLTRIMKDKVARTSLDPRVSRPTVPEGLAAVVRRATAQDPSARTPTALAFEGELRAWLDARRVAESAPLTTLRSADLPQPPRTVEVAATLRPTPAPAPRAESAPVATMATGAAGAAGFVGIGVVAGGSLLAAVIGVGLLAVFAPPPLEPAFLRVVDGQHHRLAACRGGADGKLTLRVARDGGKVSVKPVSGDLADPARRCVVAALTDGDWPPGRWSVTLPIELR